MSEIVHIPFHGDDLMAVDHHGRPHVVLKPAFEAIGLNADRQIKKVQRQAWAVTAVTAGTGADGKRYQMVTADLRTFLMTLATIPTSRVAEHVRAKLVEYQCEVADVIEQYWTTGRVLNPRRSDDGFFEPTTLTYDEVCALLRQRYGMSFSVVQLCRMLRTAGVLKVNGAPKKKFVHWYWFTDSAWNIHPHVLPEVAGRLVEKTREIQEFRFIQARLELEGLDLEPEPPDRHRLET